MSQPQPPSISLAAPEDRMVSRAEIAAAYGVSKMCVYFWQRQGKIPQPIRLSPRCLRWRWSEVVAALEGKAPQS
jgi:prophage regulatory protein